MADKKLTFRREEDLANGRSAQEIVDRLATMGYEISLSDAHHAWEAFSSSMCAGWMSLPDEGPDGDEDILREVQSHCDTQDV
jgi:hypothetical protein